MAAADAFSPYLAEFLGTFLLVFTVGCNVSVGSPMWGVTSIACVLMIAIYALGPVSGAHLNPAVTFACAIAKRETDMQKCFGYVAAQLGGGIFAGGAYVAAFGKAFNLKPGLGFHWFPALTVEALYTFFLVLAVLTTACKTKSKPNEHFGLAIGFSVVAGGYAAGWISGGCFNPAVAFGVDVSSAHLGFGWSFAWTVAECVGAFFAAITFKALHPEEFEGDAKLLGEGPAPKLLAEFIGTFFLVLTVGLNVLSGGGAAAWSIAASLMVAIYALGPVSGAHFNPAVTCSILLSGRGKITPVEAGAYVGAQVAGGLVAGFTYKYITGAAFALAPGPEHSILGAMMGELVFTFVLCFVVLTVATTGVNKGKLDDFVGLIVGSCVTVGGYAVGSVSGGSLNPAVSIAIDTTHLVSHGMWSNCLFYCLAELAAAGVAAGLFRVTHKAEFAKGAVEDRGAALGSA